MSQNGFQNGIPPVEIHIGDRALYKKSQFFKTVDLGCLWKELTGLPFVYAVWQSNGTCLNGLRKKILDIGERTETKMSIEPTLYLPKVIPRDCKGKSIDLADYWKKIYYRLGSKEFQGLIIFLSLARCMIDKPFDEKTLVKFTRWQELSQSGMTPGI